MSIMHSSGTTGIPKAVTQTHASSVAGPRFRLQNYVEPAHERMMTAQPQSHLGCIVYTAYSILAGTPLVALYDPTGEELAAAVHLHRPKGVMAFAHAYSELAALETPTGTVDSVDYWVNMGDAIHEAHIGAILAKRSPDQEPPTFYDRFGTTELGWGLVVQPRTLASERAGPPHRQARSRRRGRGAAGRRQQGAGRRGGLLRSQGPVHHRRVLERLRYHLPLQARWLLADR